MPTGLSTCQRQPAGWCCFRGSRGTQGREQLIYRARSGRDVRNHDTARASASGLPGVTSLQHGSCVARAWALTLCRLSRLGLRRRGKASWLAIGISKGPETTPRGLSPVLPTLPLGNIPTWCHSAAVAGCAMKPAHRGVGRLARRQYMSHDGKVPRLAPISKKQESPSRPGRICFRPADQQLTRRQHVCLSVPTYFHTIPGHNPSHPVLLLYPERRKRTTARPPRDRAGQQG